MSHVSVAAIARMMFGRAAKGRFIAVLGAFFDDSGTHAGSPLVVIGGLLGTDEQWDAFAAAWEALLAKPLPGKPPLRQFHLSPCRAREGEFESYNEAERNRITYLFRRIILDVGLVTVAAAVNKVAWDELVTDEMVGQLGDPIELCFVKCVDSVISIIRRRKPGEMVLFFFDQATKIKLEQLAKFYRIQAARYPEIAGISFAPVPNVVALQGADMIATETYQYGREWLKAGESASASAHFREFLKRDLSAGFIFDREHIEEAVRRIRENLARAT